MPEREELTLVVTLDDQASAKLANLKQQLGTLESSSGGGIFGKMGDQSAAASRGVKALQGELGSLAGRAGFIGGVVGGITSELTKMGTELLKEVTNIQKLSTEMNNLSVSSYRMGTSAAQLESNLRGFRQVGVSFEEANKQLGNFNDTMADLSLVNSQVRGSLLSGGFLEIPKMLQFMQRSDLAKTPQQQIEVWRQAAHEVRHFWTEIAGPQEGAKREKEFLRLFGADDLDRLKKQLRDVSAEEQKMYDVRGKAAAEYIQNNADIETGYDRIVNSVGAMIIRLNNAIGASRALADVLNGIGHVTETLERGDLTPPNVKSAIQDKLGKFGIGVPGASTSGTTPPASVQPYGNAMPYPFAGGGAQGGGGNWNSSSFMRSGGAFWQNLHGRDGNVEDRRNLEDNTEQSKDLTDAIKTLNDNLTAAPPGSLAASLGFNQIGGGGGGGGGPTFRPGIGPGRGGDGGGGGGGGRTGPAKITDEKGVPVDPETEKQVEELAKKGDVGGMQKLLNEKGFQASGPWCGRVAAGYAKAAGFQPPGGSAVATNWRNWGEAASGADINKGHPFGSMTGTLHQPGIPTGSTGSHVMQVLPGSYDPKTNTAMFVDQHGVRRRNLSGIDMRYAGDDQVAKAAAAKAGGGAGAGGGGGDDVADALKWVKSKESFKPTAFADYGQRNIGYGTSAKGRTSISESEASNEAEGHLKGSMARINAMNPNLSHGQKLALASLDFNVGWTTRGGDKNESMRAAIKNGDLGAARELFGTYTHVGGPRGKELPGLVSRRKEELSIWDKPDSGKLDSGSQEVTVNGKGKLDVNVSGPPGTRVSASGEGLLKDTSVQQETQMTPASKAGAEAMAP